MRFILTILLFLSQLSYGQIINASRPYRPIVVAAAPADLLLDSFPGAAAAYSLRKLDKDYTGSAIRVRRSSDNTEQDIGFTAGGDLDTTALKDFVGAGNSGFVVTWYSQADSAGVFGVRSVTQATAANQPRIVNAGVVDRENGKVCVVFDGSNDILVNINSTSWDYLSGVEQPHSYVIVAKPNALTNDGSYISIQSAGTAPIKRARNQSSRFEAWHRADNNNTSIVTSPSTISTIQYLFGIYHTGTTTTMTINGSTVRDNVSHIISDQQVTINRISIGGVFRSSAALLINMNAQEFLLYPSSQSSNRTGIESNINTYYGIY